MPTYTKETALYDTGAIKDGIDDAGTKADNYLTDVSGGGVMVHPSDDSTSGWKISSALELLKSGISYIWAGLVNSIATVRIGKETGGHSVIDENGMRIYGGSNGATRLANIGYDVGQDEGGHPSTNKYPYYTLGIRADNTSVGNYSIAEGVDTEASGYASHSEGSGTRAIDKCSHAEGIGTITTDPFQHVQGKYNRFDHRGLFMIGNGYSPTNRSNAFEVNDMGDAIVQRYLKLDIEGNLSRIRSNAYNNKQHIYYCTEGYHSFYCNAGYGEDDDGNGVAYIAPTYAQFNIPITIGTSTKKLLARSTVSKDNQTIAGSGTKYGTITIDASKSGYTPIGVLGYDISNASSSGANSSYISVYEARISGSNVSISVRNNHSSAAAKIKVAATVLYTPSTQGIDSI